MATNTGQWAHRLGCGTGRAWGRLVQWNRQVQVWLMQRGLPAAGASALLWIVKLIALGLLLYAAFWMAVVLLFAVGAIWLLSQRQRAGGEDEEPQPEWRMGLSGYGLYRGDVRIDPGSPDDD